MTDRSVGPRCGNNPNVRLTPGDQKVVDDFRAQLALREAAKPHIERAVWEDSDPLMEVIAATVWKHCARDDADMPQLVCDDPRTIAAFAAAVVRAHAAGVAPATGPECAASISGHCLAEGQSETACDTDAGECVHGGQPATDQTALRDRIADALRTTPSAIGAENPQLGFPSHHQPGESGYLGWCALCVRDIDALAAAVLAVLPATADRAPTLRELEQQQRPNTPPSRPEPRLPDHTVTEEEAPHRKLVRGFLLSHGPG